jgi:hypothetical protein
MNVIEGLMRKTEGDDEVSVSHRRLVAAMEKLIDEY